MHLEGKPTGESKPKGWFSFNRPDRFDCRCHLKRWSYDRDDYMRTFHKRSLLMDGTDGRY